VSTARESKNQRRLFLKTRISIAVGFVAILAVAFAYGQSASPVLGSVNIPFKFMVAKKEMPAGKYEVVREEGQGSHLLLRNMQANTSIYVSVIERLAETDPSRKHGARVVFDTVGDQRFLSEFWPADNGDGYLLGINKREQKHEVVEQK
jgi:threonine dehydrogenase-like Zn-dependent dehydrogenase